MQYLQSIGALETIALVIFVAVGIALRNWLNRAERDGRLDRSRWVFRRGTVANARGMWASPNQRSAAERNQPEQELPPLPFRDQHLPDDQ
jgi:hypothetical protein